MSSLRITYRMEACFVGSLLIFTEISSMWYKIAQQFENITKSRTPSSVSGNAQGITVSYQDYQKLRGFGTGSGPITVNDTETNQSVTVVHGGLDPEGNFAFSKGNNEFVFPENNPNWSQELGVNPSNFIVSCYEGAAKAGGFTSATNYQGRLNLQLPVNPEPNQPVKIPISGG